MEDKIKILLDKIGIEKDNYKYFENAKLTKIKVNSKNNSWNIFIKNENPFPLEIIEELDSKKMNLDENTSSITFVYDIENIDLNTYYSYYKYVLKKLKDDLKVIEIYEDALKIEDGFLLLVASTEVGKKKLSDSIEKINKVYKSLGYKFNIDVTLRHEDTILNEIKKELETDVVKTSKVKKEEVKQEVKKTNNFRREKKDPNSIIGRAIKESPIKIKTLLGEDNNVVVEAKVFGTDYFESSKQTLKLLL